MTMIINDSQLKKLLLEKNIISEVDLEKIIDFAKTKKLDLFDAIIQTKEINPDLIYEAIGQFYQISYKRIEKDTIDREVLLLIPEPIARAHDIIAYAKTGVNIQIAVSDPSDLQTIEFIKKKFNDQVEICLTTPGTIIEALKLYHQDIETEFKEQGNVDVTDQTDLKKIAENLPIVRIVDTVLEYAIFENASDIHIEPTEKNVIIRYRIDGILRSIMTLPKKLQAALTARIKVLANLKLDEHRLPQDGRFKIVKDAYKISFRVSVIPVFDGEKVVLRLLNESSKNLSLEDLGLQDTVLEVVKNNIKKPHGIILVTGPTGSGKTTTLYTVMHILNRPEVNISTIEDPIEYRMPGVNQSQVNPRISFDFATGLRSLLRQDPNIIMVGEIRDSETAEIAIRAALTGHLVMSTLHTNDACTTPSRLINMGTEAYLLASSLNLVIAQRLVRKICQNCIQSYELDSEVIKDLKKHFDLDKMLKFLLEANLLTKDQKTLEKLLVYRGKGCKHCGQMGYRGRLAIFEILENTPEISNLIIQNASADQIRTVNFSNQLTLAQDGFIKALKGLTTIEEVIRVSQE